MNNAIDIIPASYYAKAVGTRPPNRYHFLRCPECTLTDDTQYRNMDDLVLAAIKFDREHTERCNNALHQARQYS